MSARLARCVSRASRLLGVPVVVWVLAGDAVADSIMFDHPPAAFLST